MQRCLKGILSFLGTEQDLAEEPPRFSHPGDNVICEKNGLQWLMPTQGLGSPEHAFETLLALTGPAGSILSRDEVACSNGQPDVRPEPVYFPPTHVPSKDDPRRRPVCRKTCQCQPTSMGPASTHRGYHYCKGKPDAPTGAHQRLGRLQCNHARIRPLAESTRPLRRRRMLQPAREQPTSRQRQNPLVGLHRRRLRSRVKTSGSTHRSRPRWSEPSSDACTRAGRTTPAPTPPSYCRPMC